MNLERTLQSVGQTCFVQYFELFSSSTITRPEIIEILKKETDFTEKSCASRTSHAQKIVNSGKAIDALNLVIESKHPRIAESTRNKAKELVVQEALSIMQAKTKSSTASFTSLQGQYLAFIYWYSKVNGVAPAEKDIQRYFKVTPPTTHQMVVKLHDLGLISREPGKPRSIKVLIPVEELPFLE